LENEEERLSLRCGELRQTCPGMESQEAGDRRTGYAVRLIRAGKVRAKGNRESGIYIPGETLKTAVEAGLFEGKASFLDHAGWGDYPSLRDLVGVTMGATWNEAEQAVECEIRLYGGPAASSLRALLNGILADRQEGSPIPDMGLSLVFWPRWAPRDNPEDPLVLAEIRHIESCDFVFEPGADGRIIERLSSLRQISKINQTTKGGAGTMEENVKPHGSEEGQAEQKGSEWLKALSHSAAQAIIAVSGLPEASRERLSGRLYATPEEVNEAITAERGYLARLQEGSVVQIGGSAPRSPHISMGLTGLEQVEKAMEALISGTQAPSGVAPLSGIREAYVLLSGDYEMTGLFHPERVSLANVTCATMPALVANALNKRVMNLFQEYPKWWEKIVSIEDFSTLQDARWITLGGVGELPTVAEGAAYTELTWADQAELSTFVKKGGFLGITLEAMDKDDTRKLQAAPRALAQAAWLSLNKAVSAIFTANAGIGPAMSDGLALFHATHGNLGNLPLSYVNFNAVRLAMRKHTEKNSNERLGGLTAPKYLLVPPDLEMAAVSMLASERIAGSSNNDANPHARGNEFEARMNSARDRVIVVDLWIDTNDWAAVADPKLYPTVGIGFRYGRAPEIFSIASPTAGLMFTHDTMPVKARFFFAAGPINWRGLYKNNVTGG
jgi:hypothetical protein